VSRPVEEVGIAERDVLGPRGDLLVDVGQHDVDRHRSKVAIVDRDDRAVTATVLATARGIRSTRNP
jgi:hypothetical protein